MKEYICFSIWPFNNVDDDHVADEDAEEGEEVDKEEKREVIDSVDDLRINTKESEFWCPIFYHHLWVHLHYHVRCALVELHAGVLHLPEHDGLHAGQDQGHKPGAEHHQSVTDQR